MIAGRPDAVQEPVPGPSGRYEIGVLLILACVNGITALDRLAVNFLSPYIVVELGLNNRQLGLLSSALSLAIAVSGLILGAFADASGLRKRVLLIALVAFSILSAGSGLALGFGTLALARLLLGFAEGPVVPLAQSLMADASRPSRRGFNMGAMQIGGAFLIGAMIGPVITIQLAEHFGWRAAFFASAIPGLAAAILIARFVRHVPRPTARNDPEARFDRNSIVGLLAVRNIVVSMLVVGLFTAWLTIQNIFMPLYLIRIDHFSPQAMSLVLGLAGLGGLVGGLVVPALADRFGRRPVMIAAGFASLLAPLAMLLIHGSALVLAGAMAVGWLTIGCAPLVCAVIPSESVPPQRITTAIALSMFSAELLGGVLTPPLAGWAADGYGLHAPFVIAAILALGCGLLSLLLRETMPIRR
jgi:MFS family permease